MPYTENGEWISANEALEQQSKILTIHASYHTPEQGDDPLYPETETATVGNTEEPVKNKQEATE